MHHACMAPKQLLCCLHSLTVDTDMLLDPQLLSSATPTQIQVCAARLVCVRHIAEHVDLPGAVLDTSSTAEMHWPCMLRLENLRIYGCAGPARVLRQHSLVLALQNCRQLDYLAAFTVTRSMADLTTSLSQRRKPEMIAVSLSAEQLCWH